MHELHLLRHAKSSQDDGVDDRERPLSRRGRDDARAIARHLPEAVGRVDLVLCSSALRTRETLELVMVGFSPRPSVLTEDALYLASPATLLRRLRRIKEACGTVMVIGHNPGLHELASLLCAPDSPDSDELLGGKFPTLARASFRVETRWAALDAGRNPLIGYVTPKLLGAED